MIPYGKHSINEEDVQAVSDILRGGALTQGQTIELFEMTLAEYVGAKYAVAVSSGTAALHLSVVAAGLGPDSALVTSPITFVASANAGLYVGGQVTFTDIDSVTINMSPANLEKRLKQNPNTRVVIPVHFAGLPCDMEAISLLTNKSGMVIIEDAAHALGATYPSGKRVGCCEYSSMTCFSFHPVKAIAAGEGGAITTNDYSLYRKLLRLRSHGVNKLDDPLMLPEHAADAAGPNPWYYEMQELGFNYRITDIQSALAVSQMKRLDAFIAQRKALVERYDHAFAGDPVIRPAQSTDKSSSGNHIYPVCIDFAVAGKTRREVMLALRARGVGSQVHYIPVPMHPLYQDLGHSMRDYPEAADYYRQALTLPLFFELSFLQQDFVIKSIREVLNT